MAVQPVRLMLKDISKVHPIFTGTPQNFRNILSDHACFVCLSVFLLCSSAFFIPASNIYRTEDFVLEYRKVIY